jgi:uncharacterized membrane protein
MSTKRKILVSVIVAFLLDIILEYIPIQNRPLFGCGLFLAQNILIPFFATRILITDIKLLIHSKSEKITGILIGAIYGGIIPLAPAILVILTSVLFPKIANNIGQLFKDEAVFTQSIYFYLTLILAAIMTIIIGAFVGLVSELTK